MSKPRTLSVGDLTLLYEPGLVRRISFGGVEVIRMINAPVRDGNWATLPATVLGSKVEETGDRLVIEERFEVGGALNGHLIFEAKASGTVTADLALTAKSDVSTNRAGFTLLHPIAGVAGADVTVRHGHGSTEETRFPTLISAGQPALDIVGLRHDVNGVAVDIAFEGEVFEMEDQRNWSDASFKTYCRALALPTPYKIAASEIVRQRIVVTFAASSHSDDHKVAAPAPHAIPLPAICLACEPDWLGSIPDGMIPLLRFDGAQSWTVDQLLTLAQLRTEVDVEIIVPDGTDAATQLRAVKDNLDAARLQAVHIITLPEAYLNSYQPSGPWPDGLTPADCARAAREIFPDVRVGVGMLTNFTEFNRHPPDMALGDYATFANTAIVHAADDLSVWETLEALPDIFASARALSGDLPLRLGLVSIGMRSNPYGAALVENPDGEKLAMAGEDPRQDETFAAAYAVAAFALAAEAGIEAITLASPTGRFGLQGDDRQRPIDRALKALGALGEKATLERSAGTFSLSSPAGRITARLKGSGMVEIEGLEGDDGS